MTTDDLKAKYRDLLKRKEAGLRARTFFMVPGHFGEFGKRAEVVPGLSGECGARWYSYTKVNVVPEDLQAYLESVSPNPRCPACTFGLEPHRNCILR